MRAGKGIFDVSRDNFPVRRTAAQTPNRLVIAMEFGRGRPAADLLSSSPVGTSAVGAEGDAAAARSRITG